MKKLLKFIAGVTAIAGAVCGVIYFLKNYMGIDLFGKDDDFDDFDDDDFDDEFDDDDYEEDSDDREYVTLDMEDEEAADSVEETSDEE